jgi:TRAP-type transport system periplasmic protein
MQGLKMRVVGSPIFNDIFTALGANPTQMSWADAQPALTTGAVDGQENPLTIYDTCSTCMSSARPTSRSGTTSPTR